LKEFYESTWTSIGSLWIIWRKRQTYRIQIWKTNRRIWACRGFNQSSKFSRSSRL